MPLMPHDATQFQTTRDKTNAIAARSSTDPRTVTKYLSGHVVRLSVAERIDAAAREMGIPIPDPDDAA